MAISITTYASSISYFTFLSLVPILSICITLLTAVGINEQDAVSFLVSVVPEAVSDVVEMLATDAFASSGLAFSLSTITLLWSASKGAKALRVGLNAAYALRETRSPLAVELISVVSGLIMDVLIAATVYLVFNGSALRLLANVIPGLRGHDAVMDVLNSLGTMAIGVIWLSACYAYLPAGRRSLSAQLPGAVCATLACGALSFGFRVYVDNFSNFTMLYGSIATIALLLFWMYLVSYILIAGGILNRLLACEQGVE